MLCLSGCDYIGYATLPTYGSNQMTMYNAIVSSVKSQILTKSEIKKVIPNGTAVQNLRTSFIGDKITRDGYHMSYDKGRYVTALTFAKSLTGCDLSSITYTPSSYTYTAEEITAMKEAADNACAKPYEVTVSIYPPAPEDPNRDYTTASLTDIISWKGYDPAKYEKLDVEMTKFAYYNSSNNTYLSDMVQVMVSGTISVSMKDLSPSDISTILSRSFREWSHPTNRGSTGKECMG